MENFTDKITQEMKAFGDRLARYEAEYASIITRPDVEASKTSSRPDAGAVVAANLVADQKEQGNKLTEMRTAFNNLQKIINSLQKRMEDQERKLDDLEQYGRSNCLIVHKCEGVPKKREYLEHEKYICSVLNDNLQLNPPLQLNDIDVAHPLPSNNNNYCPVIVKFLRRSQRNYVYSRKRLLKGKRMVITESLTKRRLQLLNEAREVFDWKSVWSFHGDIYAFAAGRKQVIRCVNDIAKIKQLILA